MANKDVATSVSVRPAGEVAAGLSEKLGFLRSLTLAGLLLAMWIVLAFSTRTFLTPTNFANLARQASLWSIIAIGQSFVIITGGIDLSVGAVIGFTGAFHCQ